MAFGKKKKAAQQESAGFVYKPREFDRDERIALQKIVSNIPVTKKILTQSYIVQATYKYVDKYIKIGSAAAKNVNTTLYPQVFFESLRQLIESTEKLVEIEPYWRFENGGPTQQLAEITEKRDRLIQGFIYESFTALVEQIGKKRTASAKQRLFDEYQAALFANAEMCGEQNLEFFKQLCAEKLDVKPE